MENAFALIKQLVEDFKNNEKFYLSDKYQESHARQDFIDKFFAALGWDVTHERQKNPYEQEVKIENKVSTQGSQRRADYAFFVAPNFRDVKFYAEAKKPAKNLKDAAFYHQTIRYGWNSGTPIAILTDFEEFHILDCRYKPDIDDALNRKLAYFHYSEYTDEEKFKKIFYLFSREAVANGSLEKYAATLPKPRRGGSRGKAKQRGLFKGGYQPVDEAFLEELDSYRETLAKAFKKENPDLGSEELTEAVQRTIDRLVFIRFLEDKQIEDPQMINYSEASSAWKKFSAHCRALEPKYNGLVFKKHRILDESEFVPPDDNTFADICNELADPSSPYDFDKIPISILGSIYERFLGKVVHATAKQVKVELKPEVRKAGGVYYTPQYIVRYIVKETVGKLLYNNDSVIARIETDEVGRKTKQSDTKSKDEIASLGNARNDGFGKTPEEVAKMSFADIACGSGSFLIEVYSVLLEYHERYYAAHPEAAKKGDLSTRDGKQVLSLKKRQEILVNNIYGVDIDFQATEVTQLSLYLKLLEEATLNDAVQFSLLKEKLLPDLRNNIICGNSLIATDIFDGELFAHNISSPSQGEVSHRDEGVEKLKPMNFEDAFPTVMKRGGFDVVVGNPPWVRMEVFKNEVKYFSNKFKVYHKAADLYAYFIEKALSVIKRDGLFSYIVSNKWMRAEYGKPLRKLLIGKNIEEIIDFEHLQVFKGATTYPCILRVLQNETSDSFNAVIIKSLNFTSLFDYISDNHFCIKKANLNLEGWVLANSNKFKLIEKISKQSLPLSHFVEAKINYGIKTGLNEAFIVDVEKRNAFIKEKPNCEKLLKPYLEGKDLKRYGISKTDKYVILIPNGYTNNNLKKNQKAWEWFYSTYTPIAKHLQSFEQKAKMRYDQGEYWWELRACDYYDKFELQKICWGNLSAEAPFTIDRKKYYVNAPACILPIDNLFILGCLNSYLLWWFLKDIAAGRAGGFIEAKPIYVQQLPIRTIDFANEVEKAKHDHIVNLVEQMLKAKEELAAAKLDQDVQRLEHRCTTLDRQIDEAVYELYGLTEEEIKIVEGKLCRDRWSR
jgi:type I restriction-modification system DNA methylase subunit